MAYTVTIQKKTVVGDMRMHILQITADAATQSVATGMDYVYGVSVAPYSMNSGAIKIKPNTNASGTATNGTLGISGCTGGDAFFVTVFGR